MKTKIDFELLKKKASANEVSIYLLVKREVNYRRANEFDYSNCGNCKSKVFPCFRGKEHMQCDTIGVGDDFYADVNKDFVCNEYQASFTRKG